MFTCVKQLYAPMIKFHHKGERKNKLVSDPTKYTQVLTTTAPCQLAQ